MSHKPKLRFVCAACIVLAAFALLACGKPSVTYEYALSATVLELTEGDTAQLSVLTTPEKTVSPTFTSDTPAVATVSANGVVMAMSAGIATVTAKVDGKELTCVVTVEAATLAYVVSGKVTDAVGAVEGATVSIGTVSVKTDAQGAYTLTAIRDKDDTAAFAPLTVQKDGYDTVTYEIDRKFDAERKQTVAIELVRTTVSLGRTGNNEFTMLTTRSREGLHVAVQTVNVNWFNATNARYRIWFSTKDNDYLNGNSYVLEQVSTGHMFLQDRSSRHRSYDTTDIKVTKTVAAGTLTVEYVIPFGKFGLAADEVLGMTMTSTLNSTAGALVRAVDQVLTVPEDPTTYVRVGADNVPFINAYNCRVEDNPVLPYDKQALTQGKNIRFALPGVANANADDIYVRVDRTEDAFVFDMVGFGEWAANERIRITLHTSATDGRAWALQTTDLVILCDKTKANAKTGLTDSFAYTAIDQGTALATAPSFSQHAGYFTYKVTVRFSEIPGYSATGEVTAMFMETIESTSEFYNVNWWIGSIHNGVICGDNAMQVNYIKIQ